MEDNFSMDRGEEDGFRMSIFDKEGAVAGHLGKVGTIFLGVFISYCCCKSYYK